MLIKDKNRVLNIKDEDILGYEIVYEVPNKFGLFIILWILYSYLISILNQIPYKISFVVLTIYFLIYIISSYLNIYFIIRTKYGDIKIKINSYEELENLKKKLDEIMQKETNIF